MKRFQDRAWTQGLFLTMISCSPGGPPPVLEGLLSDVPIYTPSSVVKRSRSSIQGPRCVLDTMTWVLHTHKDREKIRFFYHSRLRWVEEKPGPGGESGKYVYELLPDGGDANSREQLAILVDTASGSGGGTQFRIREAVCRERRKTVE